MRFAESARGLAVAALLTVACSSGFEPLSSVDAPAEMEVQAERLSAVRVTWTRVDNSDVIGYAIERRANLKGDFTSVVGQFPQSDLDHITWIDNDVEPETYYGYRVRA